MILLKAIHDSSWVKTSQDFGSALSISKLLSNSHIDFPPHPPRSTLPPILPPAPQSPPPLSQYPVPSAPPPPKWHQLPHPQSTPVTRLQENPLVPFPTPKSVASAKTYLSLHLLIPLYSHLLEPHTTQIPTPPPTVSLKAIIHTTLTNHLHRRIDPSPPRTSSQSRSQVGGTRCRPRRCLSGG